MAIDNAADLATALKVLRSEIGKKDIPAHWVEFLLMVAAAGPKGVTTKEVADCIGMSQGISSRTVRVLSRYPDAESRKQMGYDMLVTVPDYEYRHRQRVFLSAKGEHIFKKLDRYFKVVDPLPSSDAFQ